MPGDVVLRRLLVLPCRRPRSRRGRRSPCPPSRGSATPRSRPYVVFPLQQSPFHVIILSGYSNAVVQRVVELPVVLRRVAAACSPSPTSGTPRPAPSAPRRPRACRCSASRLCPSVRNQCQLYGCTLSLYSCRGAGPCHRSQSSVAGTGTTLPIADRLAAIGVPGLRPVRPADQPVVDLADDLNRVRRRPLLRAHLAQLAVLLLRRDQHLALLRIVRARLLHVHVLARLRPRIAIGACQWSGVAMVITSTSLRLERLPEILVRLRPARPSPWLPCPQKRSSISRVHIAHMRDAAHPCLLACNAERCAPPRPFSPMTAKLTRSLAPRICA